MIEIKTDTFYYLYFDNKGKAFISDTAPVMEDHHKWRHPETNHKATGQAFQVPAKSWSIKDNNWIHYKPA